MCSSFDSLLQDEFHRVVGSCNLDRAQTCANTESLLGWQGRTTVSNTSQQYEAARSAIEAATVALSDPLLRWRRPSEGSRIGMRNPGAKEEPEHAWMEEGDLITSHEATALAACFENTIHELRCVSEATAKGIFAMLSRIVKLHKRGWTIKSRPRERCLAIGAGCVLIQTLLQAATE